VILCPPVIIGGISRCSEHIRLRGQMTGATVRAFQGGDPVPIVDAVASWPDEWYPVGSGVTLRVGEVVRAEQELDGAVSARSSEGVGVIEASSTLPVFLAPVQACGAVAALGGITPGADVQVRAAGGAVLADVVSPGVELRVVLSRPIGVGEVLRARTTACGSPSGGTVFAPPAEAMEGGPDGRLPAPVLATALRCQRILRFTRTQAGAVLSLRRDSGTVTWTCTDDELHGRIDPPLEAGETLTYWQSPLPKIECKVTESATTTVVVSADPPPPPSITTRPCPGTGWLRLSGLVPSATVKIFGPGLVELCAFEAAEDAQEVDLGPLRLQPGQRLQAAQGLCGQFGLPSPVPSWVTRPVAPSAPEMPERFVECGTAVRIAGLSGACRVSVFSERLEGRIGFAFAERGGAIDVAVSPPLLEGDRVYAVVTGCSPGSVAREVEPAEKLRSPVIAPPHDGDRSVVVSELVPGCQVDVLVNDRWAGGGACAAPTARFRLREPLRDEWRVEARVRLCDQQLLGEPVFVTPLPTVRWSRPTPRALRMNTGHHMSGRANAVLPLPGGRILVGTEDAGVWLASPGAGQPLSLDWPTPSVLSLFRKPRSDAEEASGKFQILCGTTNGLMVTDFRSSASLLTWRRAAGIPSAMGPGGWVNDVMVSRSTVVVATNRGIWWSLVQQDPTRYTWSTDPLVSGWNVLSLAPGGSGTVVGYGPRVTAAGGGQIGGFVVGSPTAGGGFTWTDTTPGVPSAVTDARLTTVVTYMANGRLDGTQGRVMAALADNRDDTWLAVLRSDDGGQTWAIPYSDDDLVFFKPGLGSIDLGYQASRNIDLTIHRSDHDRVLLVSRRGGPLGSTDGGVTWDIADWPPITDGSFHADSLCVVPDPEDASGDTLVIGNDGGVFVSRDFGKTMDASNNEFLPTLMFDQQWQSAAPALSASPSFPGLVVGAFQDNGKAYLSDDGEPWRELGSVGDGQRALFVTGDVVLNGGNDDVDLKWARWDGNAFTDLTTISPPHAAGASWMPFLARVAHPRYVDPASSAPMIAVAADNSNTGKVFGLFDRGGGHQPRAERLWWQLLGTVPAQTTGVGSFDGTLVVVGTVDGHIHLLDAATGFVALMATPPNPANSTARWTTPVSATLAFALVGDRLVRTTDMTTWRDVATPAGSSSAVIAVERALDPPRLFLAGADGAWTSRDLGTTWSPTTTGLPRHLQANHLEVVEHDSGERRIHMGTWNWSVFRATLS
jgi:hypothetical protein